MSETQAVLEASAVAITQKVTYSAGATSFFCIFSESGCDCVGMVCNAITATNLNKIKRL